MANVQTDAVYATAAIRKDTVEKCALVVIRPFVVARFLCLFCRLLTLTVVGIQFRSSNNDLDADSFTNSVVWRLVKVGVIDKKNSQQ